MEKYKLVSPYPQHQKGDIAIKDGCNFYWEDARGYSKNIPSEFFSYFEEIREKNYTIMSFMNYNKKVYLYSNGFYSWTESTNDKETEETMLALGTATIHSVRRNSDAQLFTIGDMVEVGEGINIVRFKIERFQKINSCIIAYGHHKTNGVTVGGEIIQLKPIYKVFTTSDGVDICEGDTYYYVYTDLSRIADIKIYSRQVDDDPTGDNMFTRFSTKEKAQEYIDQHSYTFTTEDGKTLHRGDIVYYLDTKNWSKNNFPVSVEQKRQTSFSQDHWFSTPEARDEYILMNKPLLSVNDIEDIYNNMGKYPKAMNIEAKKLAKTKL